MTARRAIARTSNAASAVEPEKPIAPSPSMIVVGKDVLELLSSAMYVDPLSIYREYVQNAADAVDDARAKRALATEQMGSVAITVDAPARSILIRDNGSGIPVDQAAARLLAIGASTKRGTRARGFRGVGRLAGLAYGRALTFRTRAVGDPHVLELRWDCQRLKAALRDVTESVDISSVIQRVVTISELDGDSWPEHFFEVELTDVVRTRRDALLNPQSIAAYLEQVAPVPFADDFSWGRQIEAHLGDVRLGNLDVSINDAPPLRRPLSDEFKVTDTIGDRFDELELITLEDLDGGVAAKGWLLHHGYRGSITVRSRVAGMRVRVGNVQIGEADLLEEVFSETRFNGWSVGEIHVLDPRIVPNARRDHFEQNVHFSNLTAQLEPIGRQVSKRARSASIERNRARMPEPVPANDEARAEVELDPLVSLDVPSLPPAPSAITEAREARETLSLRQKMILRKLRTLLSQSSLSASERIGVAAALHEAARSGR